MVLIIGLGIVVMPPLRENPVIFTVVSSVLTRRTLSTIGTDLPILTALLRPAQKVFTAAICARVRSL